MENPCENCITLSICKHKHFIDLRINCSLLKQYILNPDGSKRLDYSYRVQNVYDSMNPSKWGCKFEQLDEKPTTVDTNPTNSAVYVIRENKPRVYIKNKDIISL